MCKLNRKLMYICIILMIVVFSFMIKIAFNQNKEPQHGKTAEVVRELPIVVHDTVYQYYGSSSTAPANVEILEESTVEHTLYWVNNGLHGRSFSPITKWTIGCEGKLIRYGASSSRIDCTGDWVIRITETPGGN